jgi:hypothetical protein
MLNIIDKKIPEEAKKNLAEAGLHPDYSLLELETEGLVYPAISGHPDIFFCQTPQTLVIAPNLPHPCKEILIKNQISFSESKLRTGS